MEVAARKMLKRRSWPGGGEGDPLEHHPGRRAGHDVEGQYVVAAYEGGGGHAPGVRPAPAPSPERAAVHGQRARRARRRHELEREVEVLAASHRDDHLTSRRVQPRFAEAIVRPL